ncbi:MAG TPA: hypothetical protein VF908_01295 [Gemmatimonadaceae bacterium]
MLLPHQRERPRQLEHREDADQPLVDPIALGDLPGEILLPRPLTQVLVRATGGGRHLHRVLLEARAFGEQEGREPPAVDASGLEEVGDRGAAQIGR